MTTPNQPGEEVDEALKCADRWAASPTRPGTPGWGAEVDGLISLAAEVRRLRAIASRCNADAIEAQSPVDELREAAIEAQDLIDDLGDLPLERVSVERLEGVWDKMNAAIAASRIGKP